MPAVTVVHWNPRRPVFKGRLGRAIPIRRPLRNFGDLLGPFVVEEIVRREGLVAPADGAQRRLLAVGSILSLARTGDTLWGIGANGKSLNGRFEFDSLDVRAVRGPLTRAFLLERGIAVPEVYGDPALLLGHLWGREALRGDEPPRAHSVIPNFNDLERQRYDSAGLVRPTTELRQVLAKIAASELVVGSSLHAIVVAEALGIPARLVRSESEPDFKYMDYYQGSGRATFEPARSVAEALEMGGEPPIDWTPDKLLGAFPRDLWA